MFWRTRLRQVATGCKGEAVDPTLLTSKIAKNARKMGRKNGELEKWLDLFEIFVGLFHVIPIFWLKNEILEARCLVLKVSPIFCSIFQWGGSGKIKRLMFKLNLGSPKACLKPIFQHEP